MSVPVAHAVMELDAVTWSTVTDATADPATLVSTVRLVSLHLNTYNILTSFFEMCMGPI